MTCVSDATIVAVIGVAGAVIGSLATIAASIADKYYLNRLSQKADEPRRDLLRQMLAHPDYRWRSIETLMHVIGTDEESTKRLLLEIGARASEDGKPQWSLISRSPLPDAQK